MSEFLLAMTTPSLGANNNNNNNNTSTVSSAKSAYLKKYLEPSSNEQPSDYSHDFKEGTRKKRKKKNTSASSKITLIDQDATLPVSLPEPSRPTSSATQSARRRQSPSNSPPRRRVDTPSPARDDISPPRRREQKSSQSEDISPPRRHNRQDTPSPPRQNSGDVSPPRRRRQDNSPPRRDDVSPPRRKRHDSPPRRHRQDSTSPRRRRRRDSTSPRRDRSGDSSPPRKRRNDTPERRRRHDSTSPRRDSSPGRKGSPKMLDGTKSGLVTGADVQKEIEQQRQEELRKLRAMDSKSSGKDAKTVYRDKHGRKLDMLNELMRQETGEKGEEETMEWGVGLVQNGEKEDRKQREAKEMQKPFARYSNDSDMNETLSAESRWGDPMFAAMARKRAQDALRPVYRGPPGPPNRFNIAPGHRWDGVDRSNGFEKKLFENQSSAVAMEEISYKWSVEDM